MAMVLLVDDSTFSRRRIRAKLQQYYEGEIIEAADGAAAVAMFAEHAPDLVLLDLTMPVLDGYGALEQIIAKDPTAKVAIVSADIQPRARDRVTAAGAVAFVQKPPHEDILRELIEAYAS